jgi:GNAT superfamily N-acetyltransferase
MRIVNVDSEIIKELRHSGISKEMKSLESSDWMVLAEVDKKTVGASGVGGLFNYNDIQVIEKFQSKGIGVLLIREVINESRKRGYSFITGTIDPANKPSVVLHNKLGFESIFRIHYSPEIIQDVIIFTFNWRGKIVKSFLGIFNNILGMSILACLLKIFKAMFPKIINYNEKKIPNPDVKHIIKNFEKL